jgi:hypothetical protein
MIEVVIEVPQDRGEATLQQLDVDALVGPEQQVARLFGHIATPL